MLNTDLVTFDVCTHVHSDRHVCAVSIVDTLCFGVTSLNPSSLMQALAEFTEV